MKIVAYQSGKFTTQQAMRLEQAQDLLNKILANPEFIKQVAQLDPKKFFSGTSDKPASIAKMLEMDKTYGVNVAVWYVPWWKRYTSAIAYESNNKINIRSTYLANTAIQNVMSTIFHEFFHTIGYSHDFWNTKQRPYSVPYAMGNLINKFYDETNKA